MQGNEFWPLVSKSKWHDVHTVGGLRIEAGHHCARKGNVVHIGECLWICVAMYAQAGHLRVSKCASHEMGRDCSQYFFLGFLQYADVPKI